MSKFHISKNGVPSPCKAHKGNCPLGGDGEHFDSIEDAQNFADARNEQEYGLLPGGGGGDGGGGDGRIPGAGKDFPVGEIHGGAYNEAINEWLDNTEEGQDFRDNRRIAGERINDADIFRARVEQCGWQGYGSSDEIGGPGLIEDGPELEKEQQKFAENKEGIYKALSNIDSYADELNPIALSETAREQLENADIIKDSKDENTMILIGGNDDFFSYDISSGELNSIDEYETISAMKEDEYHFEDAFLYSEDENLPGHDMEGLASHIPGMKDVWDKQITPIAQDIMHEKTGRGIPDEDISFSSTERASKEWLTETMEGQEYANKLLNGEIYSDAHLAKVMAVDYGWYKHGGTPGEGWQDNYGVDQDNPRIAKDNGFINKDGGKKFNDSIKKAGGYPSELSVTPLSEEARNKVPGLTNDKVLVSNFTLSDNFMVDKNTGVVEKVDRYDVIGATDGGRTKEYLLGEENDVGLSILSYADPELREKWNSRDFLNRAKNIQKNG